MSDEAFIDHLKETLIREEVENLFDFMDHEALEDALAEAQAEAVLAGAEFVMQTLGSTLEEKNDRNED